MKALEMDGITSHASLELAGLRHRSRLLLDISEYHRVSRDAALSTAAEISASARSQRLTAVFAGHGRRRECCIANRFPKPCEDDTETPARISKLLFHCGRTSSCELCCAQEPFEMLLTRQDQKPSIFEWSSLDDQNNDLKSQTIHSRNSVANTLRYFSARDDGSNGRSRQYPDTAAVEKANRPNRATSKDINEVKREWRTARKQHLQDSRSICRPRRN